MVLTNAQGGKVYDAKRFFKKRIIRIYPIYWLLALLYIAVNTAIGAGYDFSPYSLMSSLLLFPDNAPLIIGPAWTLSYELYFYLMFGFAMMFGLLRGILLLSAFFIVAMGYGLITSPADEAMALATNSLLIEFLFGVWIAYITAQYQLPKWSGIVALLLSLGLFGVGLLLGYESLPSAVIWGIPSALLIFGVVVLERYYQPAFVEKLSPLGDSSYTLYLAHILVITLLALAAKASGLASVPVLLMTMIFTAMAIGLSHLFHLKIEAPMTRALNRWFG